MIMSPIQSILNVTGAVAPTGAAPKPIEDRGFNKLMQNVEELDAGQKGSDMALQELAAGENTNIHGTVIAYEESDIAIRAAFTARDKVVAAYEQVMNMAI